jgi:hypothetical protein
MANLMDFKIMAIQEKGGVRERVPAARNFVIHQNARRSTGGNESNDRTLPRGENKPVKSQSNIP